MLASESGTFSNNTTDVVLLHARDTQPSPQLVELKHGLEQNNQGARVAFEMEAHKSIREADFPTKEAFVSALMEESIRSGRCTRQFTGMLFVQQPAYECFT